MTSGPPSAPRILYVEDDPAAASILKAIVDKEKYAIRIVSSGKEFLKSLREETPDLVLLDLTLPDTGGLDLLKRLRETHPAVPAMVVTVSGAVEDVVTAMKRGACDYVTKPLDARRLTVSLRNALELGRQKEEIARLRTEVKEDNSARHLVGSSPAMENVRNLIRMASSSDATVLVTGENGTGKELIARALHFGSGRAERAFVDVNCAALTETLLESELFGHEQGAFTGATSRRSGKFEQAHGGTLFLDEIGDMPLSTQAKMLRVLQEQSFERVGGEKKVVVDVRVICATNQNLEQAVAENRFRQDLYYRINTMIIEAPPLRDRPEDIPELARHFLVKATRREKRAVDGFSEDALGALSRHRWPGNVRELQHAIDRALLVCPGKEIFPEHLPAAVLKAAPPSAAAAAKPGHLVEALEQMERSMLIEAMEKNGWVKAQAARALGISERMMSYKVQNLGIERPPAQPSS